MGNKRIYLGRETSKYAKIAGGAIITITSLFLVLMVMGFEITGTDDICLGTLDDPCVSYGKICNLGPDNYDIYNPDEVKLDFSPTIENYWIFFKDGRVKKEFLYDIEVNHSTKGWRYENFTDATKPRSDRIYVHRFAKYSCQEYMLVGLKENPDDVIKWGVGVGKEYLDPFWYGENESVTDILISNNLAIELGSRVNISANITGVSGEVCVDVNDYRYGDNYACGTPTANFLFNISSFRTDEFNDSSTTKTFSNCQEIQLDYNHILDDTYFSEGTTLDGTEETIGISNQADLMVPFIKFNVSDIYGYDIDNATLCVNFGEALSLGDVDIWYVADQTWDEGEIDLMCGDGEACSDLWDMMSLNTTASFTTTDGWLCMSDLQSYVQLAANAEGNVSWALNYTGGSAITKYFCSKENTGFPTLKPYLNISYCGEFNETFYVDSHQYAEVENLSLNVSGTYKGAAPTIKIYVNGTLSNDLGIVVDGTKTLTTMSDTSSSKDLLYDVAETQTFYVKLPKVASVTSATFNLTGDNDLIGNNIEMGYTREWFTAYESLPYGSFEDFYNNGTVLWISGLSVSNKGGSQYYLNGTYIGTYGSTTMDASEHGITSNGSDFWVSNLQTDNISRYDSSYNFIETWESVNTSTSGPYALVNNGTSIWVLAAPNQDWEGNDGIVSRYDLSGNLEDSWTFTMSACCGSTMSLYEDYLWIGSGEWNDAGYWRYKTDGTYDNRHIEFNQGEDGTLTNDGEYFYLGNTYTDKIYKYYLESYPNNLTIEVGVVDGIKEWNNTGEMNGVNTTTNLNTSINTFLETCTADDNGYCMVPIYVISVTPGIITIDNLNIQYTHNPNPVTLDIDLINTFLENSDGFTEIPITIESSSGEVTVNDLRFDYLGGNHTTKITVSGTLTNNTEKEYACSPTYITDCANAFDENANTYAMTNTYGHDTWLWENFTLVSGIITGANVTVKYRALADKPSNLSCWNTTHWVNVGQFDPDYVTHTTSFELDSTCIKEPIEMKYDWTKGTRTYDMSIFYESWIIYTLEENISIYNFYSDWDYEFPTYVNYLEFIPSFPTSSNVTPYGQTSSIPIFNITTYNYGGLMNLSVKINESSDCIDLWISNSSSKSDGFELVSVGNVFENAEIRSGTDTLSSSSIIDGSQFTIGTEGKAEDYNINTTPFQIYAAQDSIGALPPGTITINIYLADVDGKPTGGVLSTGTRDGEEFLEWNNMQWENFNMSSYNLSEGVMYAFTVSMNGSRLYVGYTNPSEYSGDKGQLWSTDGGVSYGVYSDFECMFRLGNENLGPASPWQELFTNLEYLNNSGLWLWADYNCDSTNWNWWDPNILFRGCCEDCVCLEDT